MLLIKVYGVKRMKTIIEKKEVPRMDRGYDNNDPWVDTGLSDTMYYLYVENNGSRIFIRGAFDRTHLTQTKKILDKILKNEYKKINIKKSKNSLLKKKLEVKNLENKINEYEEIVKYKKLLNIK